MADYQKLQAALPEYLRVALALGFFTGMRLSEVLNLEWSQVDFLNSTIRLRAGETKNNQSRTIPIVPQLRTMLTEQHARRQGQFAFVCFRLDKRGHAVKIRALRKAWQNRCCKLGLGSMQPDIDPVTGEIHYEKLRKDRKKAKPKVKMVYSGLLYHDPRRSCVRNLVRAGVPEKTAMRITGHLSRQVFERYNITSEKDMLDAGANLAAYLERNGDRAGTAVLQCAATISVVH